jgi:hypothetical protein
MQTYIVETVARASIREFWRVEAENEDEARESIEHGDGPAHVFLFDEVLGDEEERSVAGAHPSDFLAGSLDLRRAQSAAPAMLAALQEAERTILGTLVARGYAPGECTDAWSAEVRAEVAALVPIRAAIALATGSPTDDEARSYAHLPRDCPSQHNNEGDDICTDCGADLQDDEAIRTCDQAAALIRDGLVLLDAVDYVDDSALEDGRLTIVPHEGPAFRVNVTMGER